MHNKSSHHAKGIKIWCSLILQCYSYFLVSISSRRHNFSFLMYFWIQQDKYLFLLCFQRMLSRSKQWSNLKRNYKKKKKQKRINGKKGLRKKEKKPDKEKELKKWLRSKHNNNSRRRKKRSIKRKKKKSWIQTLILLLLFLHAFVME